MSIEREDAVLSPDEVRAAIGVVTDMADDLGYAIAVAVVDRHGDLRGVERPATVSPRQLERALECARAAVARNGGSVRRGNAAALELGSGDTASRGAVAVSGGPDGFALEACRAAAFALSRAPA
ncbi:MAG: hypothetical protein AB7V42_11620 [Thermoleophilia bacterium]